MIYNYQDNFYEVEIIRKNNKNTYIRIKDNKICITTNYFTLNKSIEKLLIKEKNAIDKMIMQSIIRQKNREVFSLFGFIYDVKYNSNIKEVSVKNNVIEANDEKQLEKWLNSNIKDIFYRKLMYWYEQFEEPISRPNLKIRKMKTRWGVCNTKNNNITLNYELYRYSIECLEYVIIHELSHLIEPNHSKDFWKIVSKYCPNYKEIKKKLKS